MYFLLRRNPKPCLITISPTIYICIILFSAQDAFNAFDFLGQGYIAANDMKEALLYVMEKSPKADIQSILKHFK